jgi:large subunit ribosomal protein L29
MAKVELKSLTIQELNTELANAEKQHSDLKFNNAVSTLKNTAQIKIARRDVARIKTEIRARELAENPGKRDKIQARRRKS